MDIEHSDTAEVTKGEAPPTTRRGARGSGSPGRRVAAVGTVALVVVILTLVTDLITASPRLCTGCHEIAPRADSWRRSSHSGVQCVKCHAPVRAPYALPQRLVDRVMLLGRDVAAHGSGDYQDPVDHRVSGTAPMSDEVCLQCHDPKRKATSGFRIIIDHPTHAKRNGSCVSCHLRTAHPMENRSPALTLMSACFTCHGTAKTAKAPGHCNLCHPSDYGLLPTSHKAAKWSARHGTVARTDLRQCEMCHSKGTCDGCHGIEMPHPMGWARGGHAPAAERDRKVCTKCHAGAANMCTMCHHEAYRPAKGGWVDQHASDVEKRGVTYCVSCHSSLECVRCHMK